MWKLGMKYLLLASLVQGSIVPEKFTYQTGENVIIPMSGDLSGGGRYVKSKTKEGVTSCCYGEELYCEGIEQCRKDYNIKERKRNAKNGTITLSFQARVEDSGKYVVEFMNGNKKKDVQFSIVVTDPEAKNGVFIFLGVVLFIASIFVAGAGGVHVYKKKKFCFNISENTESIEMKEERTTPTPTITNQPTNTSTNTKTNTNIYIDGSYKSTDRI